MFTGLIEEQGRLIAAREERSGREFRVTAPAFRGELALGDSVAVNGACQTVTGIRGEEFTFFAMGETLRATTLGALREGASLNLERALTPTSRLGGHFVSGHVDGVATIAAVSEERGWTRIALELPPELAAELVPKGSIAVDGISLTLGPKLEGRGCELFIIPHTLDHTTLGAARPGDRVNIETDLIGKYVLRFLRRGEDGQGDRKLMQLLAEGGFLGGVEGDR
jgi:riboflavin synthase